MTRKKIIWIRINTGSYYRALLKLSDIGITIYDNKKYKDYILIKINLNDYDKLKKYLVNYKSSIYANSGLDKLLDILKKYIIFISTSLVGIILLLMVNNLTFKVDVKTSNKSIEKLIINELKKYNLGKMCLKKNHNKIEKIVNHILDDNKNTLEWLEIEYDGLIMNVYVTEKTKIDSYEENNNCNIIADTDAKIISLNVYRGIPLKEINDYVVKGDVILSGNIIHNEEIKNTVCASGKVYGEVWYKVSIEMPFQEEYIEYTNKSRYNLSIKNNNKNYEIFKSRIKNKKIEETNLYKYKNFEINLVKEKEYIKRIKILSEKEAYNRAISKALKKFKLKLDADEKILLQKVLKNKVNNSTIYLEIFVVTKENIGKTIVVLESDNIDKSNNS